MRLVDVISGTLACLSCETGSRKPKYDTKLLIRGTFLDGAGPGGGFPVR
jgi:hypothetical protein